MIKIAKSYMFSAKHFLDHPEWDSHENYSKFGKCTREHGHNYVLTVEVTGPVVPDTGMILNYFDIDEIMKPYVEEVLDHRDLNETFKDLKGRTTAENLVLAIVNDIQDKFPHFIYLSKVRLSETPKTYAEWANELIAWRVEPDETQ